MYLLKIEKLNREFAEREKQLEKSKKWVDFKTRKHQIVTRYVELRRKQEAVTILVKQAFLRAIIKRYEDKFAAGLRRVEQRLKGKFMSLVIA